MKRTGTILRFVTVAVIAALCWAQAANARGVRHLPSTRGAARQAGVQADVGTARASASPWTPLKHQPTFMAFGASLPMLLTDGSVLVQDTCATDWWRLTPDQHGSYVNGTWSPVASM